MANEKLRMAIEQAGMEPEALAAEVAVDVKTIQRWILGRTPYPRHRARVAKALNLRPGDLWPETVNGDMPPVAAAVSPSQDPGFPAGSVAVDWTQLLADATTQIDLLDYTLVELLVTPGVIDELAEKARSGAQVRLLIAAPYSTAVYDADLELDPGRSDEESRMVSDPDPDPIIRNEALFARDLQRDLLEVPGIEIREFVAHRYNTVLRFDDDMLVLLHLYGIRTADAPRLRCWRDSEDELFGRFADHFEAIWDTAQGVQFFPTDDAVSDLPPDSDPEAPSDTAA